MEVFFKTTQEDFWAGGFGDEYSERNRQAALVSSNVSLFSLILSKTQQIRSVIEYGANIGLNIHALRTLKGELQYSALEINNKAAKELKKIPKLEVFEKSMLDFVPLRKWDFVFTKGVMIHMNPEVLPCVYELLYQSSNKYICLIEYYNPVPLSVEYRGFKEKLFKRDFAGEMLDSYKNLVLHSYGFVYKRDVHFSQDDLTWFLLEKS